MKAKATKKQERPRKEESKEHPAHGVPAMMENVLKIADQSLPKEELREEGEEKK